MAEQLPSVPEESTSSFTAPSPTRSSAYRESIQSVAWPQWQLRSALSSQSSQSGSDYSSISGASTSYMSDISGCSSSAAAAELTKIAHTMVSDGYTQRIVQAFKCDEQDRAVQIWFTELGIYWVLMPQLHGTSPSYSYEFAERWIRALTIVIASIKELVLAVDETLLVALFGKASISAMLGFIDTIVAVSSTEMLPVMLQVYVSVSNASHDMLTMQVMSPYSQRIFSQIGGLLESKEDMLIGSMSEMMRPAADRPSGHVERIPIKDDSEQWPIMFSIEDENNVERPSEITRPGGVHRNTRLMVDYILLMRQAQTSTQNSARSQNNGNLRRLIQDMVNNLETQLLAKSMLCSDPSLRYLFLLNNSYYVAQEMFGPSLSLDAHLGSGHHLKLTPECEKYLDSYLDVSWGHVLSYIPKSNLPGPLRRWINTSALEKFHSAFQQTYLAQMFWEVPDPQLRSLLRENITKKVVTGYRNYLKEHPEEEKRASFGSYRPEIMEQMLGELFEG